MHAEQDHHKLRSELEDYLSDDFFDEGSINQNALTQRLDAYPHTKAFPYWIEVSRVLCLVIGAVGLFSIFINLDFLLWSIPNPIILNFMLLVGITGFSNFIAYPYLHKYTLANGLNHLNLLRKMNSYMLVFSFICFLFLMSIPIAGLGLSLILLPAPVTLAYASRKYLSKTYLNTAAEDYSFLDVFNNDLRRIAWVAFYLVMSIITGSLWYLLA